MSSAAASIEGATAQDGRSPSVWDVIADVPGRIADESTARIGADHYRRWQSDVHTMRELGVDAYRFSISWSRIRPTADGKINQAGLDFYRRLVDELTAAGIEPWVTLYHWDMPLYIMENGGWLVRETADEFAEYADVVAAALGDRVGGWTTLHDPLLHMAYGHALGIDAPGLTLLAGAFVVTHHQLLGHGLATRNIREHSRSPVGLSNNHAVVRPATKNTDDIRAARWYDLYHNSQFSEPVLRGRYPDELYGIPDAPTDVIHAGDLEIISQPLDYYGVVYSHPVVVAAAPDNATVPFSLVDPTDGKTTQGGLPIEPTALTGTLVDLADRYPVLPPIVLTEIGAAIADADMPGGAGTDPDGRSGTDVQGPADSDRSDDGRIDFLESHLDAISAAVAGGVQVSGMFYRSLLDGWEFSDGYTRHYGLVAVDPRTQVRSPRAAYFHYRDLISRHHRSSGPDRGDSSSC